MRSATLSRQHKAVSTLSERHKYRIREAAYACRGVSWGTCLEEVRLALQRHFPKEEIPDYLIMDFFRAEAYRR